MNFAIKIKLWLCMMLLPGYLLAQQITVTGTVRDAATRETLPGASVAIKGTNTGVMTDVNGKFSIKVTGANTVLMVSFVGYQQQEISVNGAQTLDISLKSSATNLSEIVVIGYGTVQKKDLTGSVGSLAGAELVKSMNSNMTESLNGRVSGVVVTKSSNRPGSDMSIQIRGLNSINFSNEPLYVIDGIASYSGMKHLNPADIESIDVLKDASSCAIYGSRGSNGVVIVTTKGAHKKKGFNIEYSGSYGIKTPTRIPDMIGNLGNGDEYVDYRIKLWKKKYGDASLSRPDFLTDAEKQRIKDGEYYDWIRELSNPGSVTSHSINSSGGNENTSYTFGFGYLNDQGMIGNEGFKRITANVGIEHRFTKKLRTGITTYLSSTNTDLGASDALMNAYLIPPIESPYDEDGNLAFIVQPTSSKINPLVQIQNNKKQQEAFFANFTGFIDYSPIEGLSLKSQVAYQFNTDLFGEWIGKYTQQKGGVNPEEAYRSENRSKNWVWDNIATYKKQFNGNHKIEVIGLYSMQKDVHQGSTMRGEGLPYESDWHAIQTADKISDVSSYYTESSMISFMGRANYTLFDRYLLTLTGRYDGTSRLKKPNQWGFMPSIALGWQMKNEQFLSSVDFLSNLKLRLSWGKTGNNNLTNDITWTKLDLSRYLFGSTGVNGFGTGSNKGNEDLQWEMTAEYNAGVDFGFFKDRLTGSVDFYHRTTDGLIFSRSVGSVNGYNSVYQNIGTTLNKGVELALGSVNISQNDFSWRTKLTFSLNRNEIIDLFGDKKDDLGNRWFIGHPIQVIYDFKQLGIWQENEAEEAAKYGQSVGHIHVQDVNGDYALDQQDYQILGSPMPDWTAGMNNTFTYRQFDLSIDILARIGGLYDDEFAYMFTAWDNEHWNKLDVPYWTPENGANKYQQVGAQSYYTQVLGKTSGTFVKIQNITLGYAIPASVLKKINIKDVRIYGSVQNPFTFTDYIGSDPEIIGENVSTQLSLYPLTTTIGVKLNF
jgi:TonB-dependent starch-binding outer membrane protein SusC